MRFFCSADHRRSPMPSPARCTTASTPSSAARSIVPAAGSQVASSSAAAGRRTNRTTPSPDERNDAASADPTNPDAPVMATRTAQSLAGPTPLATVSARDALGRPVRGEHLVHLLAPVEVGAGPLGRDASAVAAWSLGLA